MLRQQLQKKKEGVSISIHIVHLSIDRLRSIHSAYIVGPICLPEQGEDVAQSEEDGKEGEVRSGQGQGRLLTWQIRTKGGRNRNDRSVHVSTDSFAFLCSFLDNATAMIQPMAFLFFSLSSLSLPWVVLVVKGGNLPRWRSRNQRRSC